MIGRMDSDLGRIIQRLKARSIGENTLVLVSSDNGPHCKKGNAPAFFRSSRPLRTIKRDLYEGGIRALFLARWFGQVRSGSMCR